MKPGTWAWIALLVLAFVAGQWVASHRAAPSATVPGPTSQAHSRDAASARPPNAASGLPAEARDTLARIIAGGPFQHRQDGSVFQNREHRLPARSSGWYHEYTVDTPGSDDRGARRIVTGGDPPAEFWYSDDHYRSFRRIDAQGTVR